MNSLRYYGFVLLLLLFTVPVLAQEVTCDTVVDTALALPASVCSEVADGEVCLANVYVEATSRDGASLSFNTPGDTATIEDVASLTLSPVNTTDLTWGMAVLRQGDVTMVLTGGASYDVETAVFTPTEESTCAEVSPQILLFADEETTITINGMEISFSGTVHITLTEDGDLRVHTISGRALIIVATDIVLITETMEAIVPLDEDGMADTPSEAEAYMGEDITSFVAAFPYSSTGEEIPIPVTADITPNNGLWRVERTSSYQYTPCPGETLGSPSERINRVPSRDVSAVFDFSDGISIPSWILQQMGTEAPEAVYTNPAPGFLKATVIGADDPPVEFWLAVESATNITTATIWYVDQDRTPGSCGVINFNYWVWQGDGE